MSDERREMARGLRLLADFLEAHEDVPLPACMESLNAFANSRDELAEAARVSGWRKSYNGDWFILERSFSDNVGLHVNIERGAVCRKVKIGTTLVPARPEHEVEEYEWVCDESSILAEHSAARD